MTESITVDELWAEIDAIMAHPEIPNEIPPGWITVKQFADRYGLPYATAGSQLRRAVRAGTMETATARLISGERCHATRIYRVKK